MNVRRNKVLILNQDYRALAVCTVQKAFILVYLNKAELVQEDDKSTLRTISSTYPYPSIIRLFKYVNRPYKGVMLTRQNVFKRDLYTCQYCGVKSDLTIDHVIPKSKGGKSSWENLATACRTCNSQKGDLTPEEASMPLKQKPFRPSFVIFLRDFSGHIKDAWKPYLTGKFKIY